MAELFGLPGLCSLWCLATSCCNRPLFTKLLRIWFDVKKCVNAVHFLTNLSQNWAFLLKIWLQTITLVKLYFYTIEISDSTPLWQLTYFNFTRKIVTFVAFVYIILTDFNFTSKIVTFVCIILKDFNSTRKIVTFYLVVLRNLLGSCFKAMLPGGATK